MKHLSKRIPAAVLALVMAASLVPAALAAEEETERGVLTYTEPIAPQYEAAGRFNEGLAPVKQNGKWGYIDTEGKVVIDFKYEMAYIFNEGLAVVANGTRTESNEYWSETYYQMGFIDETGKFTAFTGQEWDEASDSYKNAPLEVDGDYLDLENNSALFFHNGVIILDDTAYTTTGARIDMGTWEYYPKDPMNEGLIPIWSYDEYGAGWADANGNIVKFFGYEDRESFGPAVVHDQGTEWEWSEQSYRLISAVCPFNQGLAPACQMTYDAETYDETFLWGVLNRNYNWVIQPQFTNYFYSGVNSTYQLFGDTGLAMMEKDGKYGAIDKSGKTVIPFRYEELWPVNEGLILFMENGKYGYLDAATLKVTIPAQFEKASGFSGGLAVAYDGTKAYLIDRKGSPIPGADALDRSTYFIETEDGSKTVYSPGEYVVIQKNGKWGYGHIEYLPNLPEKSEMDSWAYPEVVAAIEENLVPTYLQNLYLNNITRDEFCDLVMKALSEVMGKDVEDIVLEQTRKSLADWKKEYPFTDTTNSNAIAAYALGIVSGRGNGVFDPYATITRQEAAALLMRSAKVLGMDTGNVTSAGFTDSGDVGVWFTDAVNFVYQIKVMGGTGNDAFSPLGTYTREQSYVTIYRLFLAVTGNAG